MSKELAIIDLIAQLSGQTEALADDAYWDEPARLVYTTDMLVENRHFSLDYFTPQDLGWKAAAVNISDLAGMGAQLKCVLISLGLPEHLPLAFVSDLYQGFQSACQQFGGFIAGGDTVGSPTLTLNVTAIGTCPQGSHPGRRFAAQPGDWVIATGFHGLSKVGLEALTHQWPDYHTSKQAHLHPLPQIQAGQVLASQFERYALMDSSDGLADALIKIGHSSKQAVVVEQRKLPIHPEVRAYAQQEVTRNTVLNAEQVALDTVLYGGEDFQLVATVPAVDADILAHFHVIGRVGAASLTPGAYLTTEPSLPPVSLQLDQAYQHFQGESP
ncbi:thiamine-phosphate kinase [Vampirovibrio chlorellavorus]|uniref:thiamine-phosphate kinase n=1 Tax=Vampirovibrio chlorellavorus TaxID=758823 RepID=UPI0026F371A5|nr:thiamine-phosphate kinase [Vampirovibrio chlorellavorus]